MSAKPGQVTLRVVPCTLEEANRYVAEFHRHHGPLPSHRFSLAVLDETGLVRGVATVGLPKARKAMDGATAEVNRVATDGCPNACSALYGAARRVAREMGFARLLTYILDEEPGTSLRASGWTYDGPAGGGDWIDRSANRHLHAGRGKNAHPTGLKGRWSVTLNPPALARWPEALRPDTPSMFAEEQAGVGG